MSASKPTSSDEGEGKTTSTPKYLERVKSLLLGDESSRYLNQQAKQNISDSKNACEKLKKALKDDQINPRFKKNAERISKECDNIDPALKKLEKIYKASKDAGFKENEERIEAMGSKGFVARSGPSPVLQQPLEKGDDVDGFSRVYRAFTQHSPYDVEELPKEDAKTIELAACKSGFIDENGTKIIPVLPYQIDTMIDASQRKKEEDAKKAAKKAAEKERAAAKERFQEILKKQRAEQTNNQFSK